MTIPIEIPAQVISELRSHIIGACDAAQAGYRSSSGHEDAVTGALGERLRLEPGKYIHTDEGTWRLVVRWKKFPSGRSRVESEIGADGIIQFEIFQGYGQEIYTKGLLFQAKKREDYDIDRLLHQCRQMNEISPDASAVFQFGRNAYLAMDCTQILNMPDASRMPNFQDQGVPLGNYIVDRFLSCEVGTEKLYFDLANESLFLPERNAAYRRLRSRLNKITIRLFSPQDILRASQNQ